MDSRAWAIAIVAALGTASLASGSASASTGASAASLSGHAWGKAIEVPGIDGPQPVGRGDAITSVSCGSAGNCSAGGAYVDSSRPPAGVRGQPGRTAPGARRSRCPAPRPSTRAGTPASTSVSCASAGNCSAGGYYVDSSGHGRRSWSARSTAPGARRSRCPAPRPSTRAGIAGHRLGVVRVGGQLQRRRVLHGQLRQHRRRSWSASERHLGQGRSRCPAPRRSTRAGMRRSRLGVVRLGGQLRRGRVLHGQLRPRQVFVVSEVNGTWGKAIEVPGTAALNQGGNANIDSVSCGSAGNCSAGGIYRDHSCHSAGVRGQRGRTAPGAHGDRGARHRGPQPGRERQPSTRCRAPRRATAARAGTTETAPATARRSWSARSTAPGTRPLRCPASRPSTRAASRKSPRCRARRRATAARAGPTQTAPAKRQAFVVSQVNGTWHTAIEVPGIAALNQGGDAGIASVSCASAGECSAGGTTAGGDGAFVVSET